VEQKKQENEQNNDDSLMQRVNQAFDHMVQDVKDMVQDNEQNQNSEQQ